MTAVRKIKTVIVDDETLARTRIRRLLEQIEDIQITAECKNGLEAVEFFQKEEADLVYLDIQMPELNGFEVLEKLPFDKLPVIIFVTAYDKYALKAFDVHAVDYLLKPFDDDRFYESLNYAKDIISFKEKNSLSGKINNLISDYMNRERNSKSDYLERITIKTSGRFYFIQTSDISRIKAAGKYLNILTGDKEHLVRKTMNEIESKLDPSRFVRIHRSTIVNIDQIKEMQHWYKSDYIITMKNGEKFTSSRTYKQNVEKVINHFL